MIVQRTEVRDQSPKNKSFFILVLWGPLVCAYASTSISSRLRGPWALSTYTQSKELMTWRVYRPYIIVIGSWSNVEWRRSGGRQAVLLPTRRMIGVPTHVRLFLTLVWHLSYLSSFRSFFYELVLDLMSGQETKAGKTKLTPHTGRPSFYQPERW